MREAARRLPPRFGPLGRRERGTWPWQNLLAKQLFDISSQIEPLSLRLSDESGFDIGRELNCDSHRSIQPSFSEYQGSPIARSTTNNTAAA